MKNACCNRVLICFFSFVLLISFNGNTFAQDENVDIYRNAVTFGIVHSFNLASMVGSFPQNTISNINSSTSVVSPRFTIDIGMTTNFYLNKKVSFQFDFVYALRGAHLMTTSTVYNEVGKIETKKWFTNSMNYLKLPLTLNYYPMEKLYVNGGGYASILLSSKTYEYWTSPEKEPIEGLENFDYGLVFGFGFNLIPVKVGFQYSYGLSSLISSEGYDIDHSVFQLVARWKLYSDIRKRR